MITRRGLLRSALRGAVLTGIAGGYASAVEPFRLRVQAYRLRPPDWPEGLRLRIAALADIHACEPWMSVNRVRHVVERTNALRPDLTVLLGDYVGGHRYVTDWVHSRDWAPALGDLNARMGVYAVMGNHDWWEDRTAQRDETGPTFGHRALAAAGITVLENDAIRFKTAEGPFWLAGLGDQLAFHPWRGDRWQPWRGMDDLPGTLAKITDESPTILLAHEPDIFPQIPARIALTLAGHTHGGQVRLAGYSPVVPSRFKNRYAYGHVREPRPGGHTDMIVSGGLGCSIMPVRFGVPPEIVLIELG
ncbi:MAG: metallophosphoesterase [Pseudomonadota bacterium]